MMTVLRATVKIRPLVEPCYRRVMRLAVHLAAALMVAACAAAPVVTPVPGSPGPTVTPVTSPTSSPTTSESPQSAPTPAPTPTIVKGPPPTPLSYALDIVEFPVPAGSHPHDVAPDPDADGFVWYTAQAIGKIGRLDPTTGEVIEIDLPSAGSAPHGIIVGPDGSVWVTDQGANTIERIDPATLEVTTYDMPGNTYAGPHTPTIDNDGLIWFTGSAGYIGRLDPATGIVDLFEAPEGAGPYGIDVTPSGEVWYVNLDASYLARIDRDTGKSTVVEPPTANAGTRRVWSDSDNRLWVSYWNAGMIAMYDPATDTWDEIPLEGGAQAYAIYVDERDWVWATEFTANKMVVYEPDETQPGGTLHGPALPTAGAAVRQLLGREGEVWGAESATDKLIVFRRKDP